MVELLRAPSLGHGVGPADAMDGTWNFANLNLQTIEETKALEPQAAENTTVESSPKKISYRQPRRAFSSNEYRLASPVPQHLVSRIDAYFQLVASGPLATSTGSPNEPPTKSETPSPVPFNQQPRNAAPARPSMPAEPQRSYSVMNYVPVPFTQRPGEKLNLSHLPPEIHFAIFDFLDPIDATCLALTSKHYYMIHRYMTQGTAIPLSQRRLGPNDMEWVWYLPARLIYSASDNSAQNKERGLKELAPKGQGYCVKCGANRCELHKHLREWMGEDREYCEITAKFGAKAPKGAKPTCSRSSPRHPHRCGRHTRNQRVIRLT